jgi:hypothetical protein
MYLHVFPMHLHVFPMPCIFMYWLLLLEDKSLLDLSPFQTWDFTRKPPAKHLVSFFFQNKLTFLVIKKSSLPSSRNQQNPSHSKSRSKPCRLHHPELIN